VEQVGPTLLWPDPPGSGACGGWTAGCCRRGGNADFGREQVRDGVDCAQGRGRGAGEVGELDDRGEDDVELERLVLLQVLEHRGLVPADAFGAVDPLVDRDVRMTGRAR